MPEKKPKYDSRKAWRNWFKLNPNFDENTFIECENPSCDNFDQVKNMELHHYIPRTVMDEEFWYYPSLMMVICKECHNKIHRFERIAYAKKKKNGGKK